MKCISSKDVLFWNELIRQGQGSRVKEIQKTISPAQVPRSLYESAAQVARRCQNTKWGLKLLFPLIHAEKSNVTQPTQGEIVEHALLLMEIGALASAELSLNLLSENNDSKILMARAFLSMRVWNYEDAYVHLRKYLKTETDPYRLTIGKVNLIASLVWMGHLQEADELISTTHAESVKSNYRLLSGNLMELKSQICIRKHLWAEAETCLNESERLLRESGHVAFSYVKKWKSIMAVYRYPDSLASIKGLMQILRKSRDSREWEIWRDCELHLGLALHHKLILNRIYYGTPYPSYVSAMIHRISDTSWIQPHFLRTSRFKANVRISNIVNVSTGSDNLGKLNLKTGQTLHCMLIALNRDFYQPVSLGKLFSDMYPDQHYDPFTSPDRIYQVIKRLREELIESQLGVEIVREGDFYSIHLAPYTGIQIEHEQVITKTQNVKIQSLIKESIEHFGLKPFSAKNFATLFQQSQRTSARLLKTLVEKGALITIGRGKNTMYLVSQSNPK